MQRRTITLLIAGMVFTAGLIVGSGGYVFAGDPVPGLDITIEQNPGGRVSAKNYSSSLSNKSIGQVRKEVGDILLRYGVGGADINKVTEALEGGGVYEAELESFLIAIGRNEKDAQDILLEFDKLGIGSNTAIPKVNTELHRPPTSVATPQQPSAGEARENVEKEFGGLDSETRSSMFIKLGSLPGQQAAFRDSATKSIQNLKAAESEEQREKVKQELSYRRVLLQQGVQALRQNLHANTQELRDNFRENVKTTIGHVDHGKTGRIALAHGKGLRMINRFRSAIARFDHILGRMESRVQKLEAQGVDMSAVIPLVEEARNMQVENEAKLVELQAKYESLLTGENPKGIAEEARAIAKELKTETENLHAKLREIATVISGFTTPTYEPDKEFAK